MVIDAIINVFLGVVLLAYSDRVIDWFGLPVVEQSFYPNILGAVLLGIGVALLIEYRRKGDFVGLGLGGAIAINMIGGIVLFIWLMTGSLNIPMKGLIILWGLDFILLGISTVEFIMYIKNKQASD